MITMDRPKTLSTDHTGLMNRQGVPNSTDHSIGDQNLEEHDSKTRAEISVKQPPIKDYHLVIQQQPSVVEASDYEPGVTGKKGNAKNVTRKRSAHAIEPMPIIELVHGNAKVTNSSVNINPLLFLYARLLPADAGVDEKELKNQLIGGHAVSIFRCKKDKLPQENGYFIFQDLRVKYPGRYRIGFTLFEIVEVPMEFDNSVSNAALPCAHAVSQVFQVLRKGTSLPDPQNATPLVQYIEAGGAKLRYRKAQTKKAKNDDNWGSTLDRMAPGQLQQRFKKRSGKQVGFEGSLIESVPPSSTFPNPQDVSQPDSFQASGLYHSTTGTSPTTFAGAEAHVAGVSNFAVPQSSFTFAHALPPMATTQAQSLFSPAIYEGRYPYQAPQFSNDLQTPQAVTEYPMMQTMHNMQSVQTMQQPLQYQNHTSYMGEQMQERQRMVEEAHYQHAPQYPNPNEGMYSTAAHPPDFVNTGYDHAYQQPQDEQQPQLQHQQYHQQQRFFSG